MQLVVGVLRVGVLGGRGRGALAGRQMQQQQLRRWRRQQRWQQSTGSSEV